MDGLALYFWSQLNSRCDTNSGEDEVQLPHVKLPEITVTRKNEDSKVVPGTSGKRKRVSFAEPLRKNGKNTGDSVKTSSQPGHYTLVEVDTDHDYAPSPLVCCRRLSDGREVKMPVEVKGIDEKGQESENEESQSPNQPANPKCSASKFVKDDLKLSKPYKTVYGWNDLLEHFDTKPEDGDKLLDELINALSDDDQDGPADVDHSLSDQDDEDVETYENGSDDDSDAKSAEIAWERSDHPEAVGSSNVQMKHSDKEPSKNVYRELFDEFVEEDVKHVDHGDLHTPDSSLQPHDVGESIDIKDDPLTGVVTYFEKQDDSSGEQPYKMEEERDSSAEQSRIIIASTESIVFEIVGDSIEHPDRSQIQPENSEQCDIAAIESFLEEKGIVQPRSTVKLPSSSVVECETKVQNSKASVPSFKDLCDLAYPLVSVSDTQARARKRNRPKTTEAKKKSGKQPKVKKKSERQPNPKKPARRRHRGPMPIELLSKRQVIARLAKEIRSSQDPRDMLDNERFKTTFGVSKEFATFLINALIPALPVHEKPRSTRTPTHLKVLTALNFFATGDKNWEIGRVTHMSQPQVSRSLTEVITTLLVTAPEPELPASEDSEFHELYGLPDIIGAVDGTQIPIRPPNGIGRKCPDKERFRDDHPTLYINSARYCSINVEVVSSSSNRVLFCWTKCPGSYTKNEMWHESKIRELMIARHNEGNSHRLIAGSEYECEPWLLTPCSATYSHSPEDKYNASLASAVQDSTRLTIGLLKGRFKCLSVASSQNVLCYSPAKACQVFTACCVLHNLAMDFGEELPDPVFDALDLVETKNDSNETNWDGLEARNSYVLENFS